MRYRTIVADPPWPMKDSGPRSLSTAGHWRADHTGARSVVPYERMSIDEIAALPVRDLAEKDAHLYLWTTSRFLDEGFDVLRAWGFRYALTLTWCKAPRGQGLGGAFSNTTEFVLLAKRGSLRHIGKIDTTWFAWKRPYVVGASGAAQADHSRKPDGFADAVEQVSPGPYLELFARRQRLGWDTWGNEALNHIEIETG